ncbi:MAG: ATP-binding protein, partial [Sphaerochaetaceae bacterium]|nr:ATP-binding protein [Sphaerochaetaceae bacterium]
MFLGRDKELVSIKEQLLSNKKTAILVYGKRRVGKSTLIAEASKNFDGIVISHLCSETTYEGNLALLCRSISHMLNIPQISFSTIFDIFDFLKSQNNKVLLILDEYQYLKNSLKAKEMDSFMQSIIDNLSPNVKLILCGSYISIMKELLQQDNPLFGRFTLIQHIQELNYLEASLFYPNLSVNDKLAFYSIFGGSPYVLTNLDYNLSVEENICNYLMDQNSILNSHITNVMLKEIQKSYDVRILEVLANGKKRYSEIQNILDKEK